MAEKCRYCSGQQGDWPNLGNCGLLMAAYILAGLAMMLNIRLSYSSAPYALIRFMLPENLFSVFVRRMASALELWCLPSMALGNIMDLSVKGHMKVNSKEDHDADAKWWKFHWIIIPSIISQWFNFLTYVILLVVYRMGGEQGHLTIFYFVIAISGFVFGINMTLVYAADFYYTPVYIVGENCFPALTSFIHYLATLMFGNRRKWNSDFIIINIDIWVAIIISFVAAVVWTVAYGHYTDTTEADTKGGSYGHIFASGFDTKSPVLPSVISPTLMVIVGMGLVYAIYPGIAPGMIVPFYLVDKIEMVLLIATFFPPVIIAILQRVKETQPYSPKTEYQGPDNGFKGWTSAEAGFYHAFDILIVIKISLAVIFIYSLHYRESSLSRSIVNQPKMSTFLSIVFYMCHEILLALGFAGIVGNNGGTYVILPAQYIGALFMIFLAFYSEGYIIEYKSHDPEHWPTEGMTPWNAFCYYHLVVISLCVCVPLMVFIMIKFNVCYNGYCDFK